MVESNREIKVVYERSPLFRVVHADGMWGGVTPQNNLNIHFYSESAAFPKNATIAVSSEGVPSEAVARQDHDVERHLEAGVTMDINVALSFYAWLEDKIKILATNAEIPDDQIEAILRRHRGGTNANAE